MNLFLNLFESSPSTVKYAFRSSRCKHFRRIIITRASTIWLNYFFYYRDETEFEKKVYDTPGCTFDREVAQYALVATEMPKHLRLRRTAASILSSRSSPRDRQLASLADEPLIGAKEHRHPIIVAASDRQASARRKYVRNA